MESEEPHRLANVRSSAVISSALVLPFLILELVNRRSFDEGFPVALFSVMWLLPFVFTLVLIPTVATLRADEKRRKNRLIMISGLTLLILISVLWVWIIVDQMPCFLGIPNCD